MCTGYVKYADEAFDLIWYFITVFTWFVYKMRGSVKKLLICDKFKKIYRKNQFNTKFLLFTIFIGNFKLNRYIAPV